MKTRLYDEAEKYTEKARELDQEVIKEIKPVITRYIKEGYSIRDIENVVNAAVLSLILTSLIVPPHILEKIEAEKI